MNKEDVYTHHTFLYVYRAGCLGGSGLKNLPAMHRLWQEPRVRFLGWEDPLEMENAKPLSILAWEIPWTEEPVEFMGSRKGWTRLSNYTTRSVCVCVCV